MRAHGRNVYEKYEKGLSFRVARIRCIAVTIPYNLAALTDSRIRATAASDRGLMTHLKGAGVLSKI